MLKPALSVMTIGTRSHTGEDRFDVINPATGLAFASAPACSEIQLEEAVLAAAESLKQWRSSELGRRQALSDCARSLRLHLEELAQLITREQGKPLAEARTEVSHAAAQFEQCAATPIPRQTLSERGARTLLVQRPIGVVGLITPWNYPVGTAAVKLAPALLMGNTVILKPSPHAPLSALLMGKILRHHLPPGVLNTIAGDDALGALMVRHPLIRKISLTGSTETGKSALRGAAEEVKRVTLELGGNDPAIILPDASPAMIAKPILQAAWRNAGQVCSAIKRIYVHESIFDQLLASLLRETASYRLGDGMLPGTTLGPLSTAEQRDKLRHYAVLAQAAGGKIHRHRWPDDTAGFFFAPGLVTGLDDGHPLVAEEQFGPLLPILPYCYIDDAVRRANDSRYGLSASIWTSNPNLGYDVASQMECGRVGINGHRRGDVAAPFGGFKQSGIGRELGVWGMLAMSETQVVNAF